MKARDRAIDSNMSRWYVVIIKNVAHQAYWGGGVFLTDCNITTSVISTTTQYDPEPTYCETCYSEVRFRASGFS